ncbi:MAG: GNAT family N-acetyltransferase [Chloroflexota bacterium]|nr:MAG: GNAT family N-acetyltransferase [Chloroflexota bacterium]
MHPKDAGPLYDLLCVPSLLSCGHVEPAEEFPAFQEFVSQPQGDQHRLVAVCDGQPVGLGILERPANPRVAHLGQISLLAIPEWRNLDIGADLLKTLIDIADSWLNLKRLEAEVPKNIPAVQRSFQQAGFVKEGIRKKAIYGEGQFQDEVSMARLRGFDVRGDAGRRPAPEPPIPSGRKVSELLIRPLAEQDADELYEIYRAPENCRTTLQMPSQELWLTNKRIRERSVDLQRLVAVAGKQVVGIITMKRFSQRCRAHAAGLGMTVHTDYWGLGIGSRLVERAMELADGWLNLTRVELIVHTDNPAGIRLYEKFGFEVEGRKPFHTYGGGGWVDSYFMARVAD